MATIGDGWTCPYCGYYVNPGAVHYCPGPAYYERHYIGPHIDQPWTWKIEDESDVDHRLKRIEEKLDKLLEFVERPSVVLVAPTEGE